MAFIPLNDRLLVVADNGEKVSASGIVMLATTQEKFQQGTVRAIGAGHPQVDGSIRALTIKQGDVVMFGKYAGIEIKVDGVDCLVLREEEVLGVVA